jgi:hypothetical protein
MDYFNVINGNAYWYNILKLANHSYFKTKPPIQMNELGAV